jgi:FAD synthase
MIVKGEVVHGFGRGSKLLGFPTANLNILESNTSFFSSLSEGIYYGYSTLNDIQYKSVMSIGLNPTFNTVKKTFEVYLIEYTGDDFYGENLEVTIVDFIRESVKCKDIEELKEWIRKDVQIATLKLNIIKH